MFLMKPIGLLALLYEESHFPKATDLSLVEVFAKPGCSREPRKYQMKAHFLLNSVVYNIVPFYILFIVHTHFSFCDW